MNARPAVVLLLGAATVFPQPTIRVTTRLVEVNVIVRDKRGPVRDLTKADFAVYDRGKPREIVAFSVNSTQPAQAAAAPLPSGVFSNAPEDRGIDPASATVILLDGLNTPVANQMRAKKQFLAFLKQIQPRDRVAVYTLGRSLRVLSDFTSDASRLAATLARFTGRVDGSPDTYVSPDFETGDARTDAIWNDFLHQEIDADVERRINITVEAFEAIGRRIGTIPGRKNLIWLSAGFPFESFSGKNPRVFAEEVNRAARALNRANIAMSPVDARGLVAIPHLQADNARAGSNLDNRSFVPQGQAVMDMMAQATGGRAFKNNNDISGAIRTVLDDSEVTYTLAFRPDSAVLDGAFHKIKVVVERPGVEARFREGYFADPDPATDERQRSLAIRQAIESPLESAGIRFRVQLERAAGLNVTVVLNAADVSLPLANGRRVATLDAVFVQRAGNGRELNVATYRLRPDVADNKFREALERGLGITRPLARAGGAVELKVVLYDRATGRLGSVIVPL